jgi:hypothetical protein
MSWTIFGSEVNKRVEKLTPEEIEARNMCMLLAEITQDNKK